MERSEAKRRIMYAVEMSNDLSLDNPTWGIRSAIGRGLLVDDIMLILDDVIESESESITREA